MGATSTTRPGNYRENLIEENWSIIAENVNKTGAVKAKGGETDDEADDKYVGRRQLT